jgi:hypothetical protein
MKKITIILLLAVGFISNYSVAQETKACKLSVAETISAKGTDDAYITTACDLESFKITIFNRMGDPIYKSEDATVFWDFNEKAANGTSNKFEQGVYKYMMTYKFSGEERAKSKAGKITLLR